MDLALQKGLTADDKEQEVSAATIKRCRDRAKKMLAACCLQQRQLVLDPSPHVAALCPRRAGKTFAAAIAALITGEAKPGSISLIISLNLKQLRRLYWSGSASGLYTLAREFKLNLTFNSTYLMWEHENGSIGYLMGCEDEEQMEVMRGLEADLYVIDECKSFAPGRLQKLIDDILDPQRSSRDGRIMMIGTPGFIPAGPFYEATCPLAKDAQGRPFLVPFGEKDAFGRDPVEAELWSFHTWSTKDNPHPKCQRVWRDGLRKKKAKGWPDDHPAWLREYMGQWTTGLDGLVFRYSRVRVQCQWIPTPTPGNELGLPEEGAPWRFVGGLDLGYEAPTAFVVCAYSRRLKQFRLVHEESRRHMLLEDIVSMLADAIQRFGTIERIFVDSGNLGKTLTQTILRAGYPVKGIEKREKLDYIELLNAGFEAGEVLIIPGGKVEEQLLTNCWKLDDEDADAKGIERLARLGKLKEDDAVPNDSTDAFLYCYRGSLHMFGVVDVLPDPEPGTKEWTKLWEKRELARARKEFAQEARDKRKAITTGAPGFVRRALGEKWKAHPSRPSTTFNRSSSCVAMGM